MSQEQRFTSTNRRAQAHIGVRLVVVADNTPRTTHHVHYVCGGGRRWDAGDHGRELSALRHELRAILAMLEYRRRWQTPSVPLALLAHARRLMHAFEGYVDCPSDGSRGAIEAGEFRKRLAALQKSFRTMGSTLMGQSL